MTEVEEMAVYFFTFTSFILYNNIIISFIHIRLLPRLVKMQACAQCRPTIQ